MYNFLANTKRMTVAAMVMALYIVILYVTQGISFGPYQIRIATSLYALAFVYPFLVVPLGLANFIANFLFGGLGFIDMIGGCFVGMATTWLIVQIIPGWLPCPSGGCRPSASAPGCRTCSICPTPSWSAAWLSVSCRRPSAGSCSSRP